MFKILGLNLQYRHGQCMQTFLLNFTRILEKNPKIYASLIAGIVLCLMLFVVEAIHIQNIVEALQTKDQTMLRAAVEPLSTRYTWSRVFILIIAVVWSSIEYNKTKKQLGF